MSDGSLVAETFVEKQIPKLASKVLKKSLGLKPGESVTIEAWSRALPWTDDFVLEARRLGAYPMVTYQSDFAFWESLREVSATDLGKLGAQELAALRASNGYVFFWGPEDRTRYHSLPDKTLKALSLYEDEWFKIVKEARVRFCRIELARATESLAKEYEIEYNDWVRELMEASLVDLDKIHDEGVKLSSKLSRGREIEITHPNGTRLELRLAGRTPYLDDGIIDDSDIDAGFGTCNIPSGVIMVAVEESHAEGVIRGNRTIRYGPGRGKTDGAVWTFKEGLLSKYSFESGARFFKRRFLRASKEKYKPGILSIGLNPKIKDAPLFEDQELGMIAFYIGSNDWLGGSSKGEFHTWILLRGADLAVDGEQLLRRGSIV